MIAKKKKIRQPAKKESKVQTIVFSVLIGFFLLMVIGFLIVSNWRIGEKRGELTERLNALKTEVQALEEEKMRLEAGLSETMNEEYWEEKAREQGYQKPGETPVVVLPPEQPAQEVADEEEGFWQSILNNINF